jgi:L-asparaginase
MTLKLPHRWAAVFISFVVMAPLMTVVSFEAQAQAAAPKKKIFFIGTGGTIAGIAPDPKSSGYDPGKVTINAILDSVPDIKSYADIFGQQLIDQLSIEALLQKGIPEAVALKMPEAYVNGCSCDMNEYRWRLLTAQVEKALNVDGYDAVIITHGTDTIEETAFFLEMTAKTDKPVILVGAVRPSNAPEPDGPDNIRQAVQVALDPNSAQRGVMIVMHNKIYPAFSVTEARAKQSSEPVVDRFASPHFGPLGIIVSSFVVWFEQNQLNTKNIRSLKFATSYKTALPVVPILWQYVGAPNNDLMALYRSQGAKAFVVAGFGLGSAPVELRNLFVASMQPGSDSVFVSASRTKDAIADDAISYSTTDSLKGAVMSGPLNPYQSKIFLQLVLRGFETHQPDIDQAVKALPATATLRDRVRAVYSEFLYRRLGLPAHQAPGQP